MMTGLIIVDESGDLGSSGSRFFTICSIIAPSQRVLLPAVRALPKSYLEKKFYNSTDAEIVSVLDSLSDIPINVSFVTTEKNCPSDNVYVYGKDLYIRALRDLLDQSLERLKGQDVHIIVDGSRFVTQADLRKMCEELCFGHGKNLKKCYKGISQNEPCLRIVDYVAGAVRYGYEQNDDRYRSIIKDKISIARRY